MIANGLWLIRNALRAPPTRRVRRMGGNNTPMTKRQRTPQDFETQLGRILPSSRYVKPTTQRTLFRLVGWFVRVHSEFIQRKLGSRMKRIYFVLKQLHFRIQSSNHAATRVSKIMIYAKRVLPLGPLQKFQLCHQKRICCMPTDRMSQSIAEAKWIPTPTLKLGVAPWLWIATMRSKLESLWVAHVPPL